MKVSAEGMTADGPVIPTDFYERNVDLPTAIIPDEFELQHFKRILNDGTTQTCVINIQVDTTRFDEKLDRYIVFGKVIEWSAESFDFVTPTMAECGWRRQWP